MLELEICTVQYRSICSILIVQCVQCITNVYSTGQVKYRSGTILCTYSTYAQSTCAHMHCVFSGDRQMADNDVSEEMDRTSIAEEFKAKANECFKGIANNR